MMSSSTAFLGSRFTGIPSDSWYSIQAFATDYYLGINGTSSDTPVVAQLSDVGDPTLWQFVAAGPDTSQGIYALRSKVNQGQFCFDSNSVTLCVTDAGRFQVYNSSSNANGVIFVLDDQSALSVDGRSSKGDPVETKSLTSDSDEVGYSWAIRNEEIIDAVAYPVTFTAKDASLSTTAMDVANTTTSVQSAAPSTITHITFTTTVPDASSPRGSTSIGGMAGSTAAITSSGTAASPQQTGSACRHTSVSTKAVLAGIVCFSLLGLGL